MHELPLYLAACRSLPGETNGISLAQQGTKTLSSGLLLDKDILGDMLYPRELIQLLEYSRSTAEAIGYPTHSVHAPCEISSDEYRSDAKGQETRVLSCRYVGDWEGVTLIARKKKVLSDT